MTTKSTPKTSTTAAPTLEEAVAEFMKAFVTPILEAKGDASKAPEVAPEITWIPVAEAGKRLNIAPSTVRQMATDGMQTMAGNACMIAWEPFLELAKEPKFSVSLATSHREDLIKVHGALMTGGRLVLAIHRMMGEKLGGCISEPEALIAWESFSHLAEALEVLADVLGFQDPKDSDFEA